MIDVLASTVQLCVRGQGGHNAGHTIIADGVTYDFHLCPSGLLNPSCINLVGSGCVVHVPSFFNELAKLKQKGLKTDDRIFLSDRAHVDFDLHQAVDGLEEIELGANSLGTTKKGIGPTFSSKATRNGVMLADIFDHEYLATKLRALYSGYKKRFGELLQYDVEEEIARFKGYAESLQSYVVDEVPLLRSAKKQNAKILAEGAQAIMLDNTFGTYPFVTSSNCSVGGILSGLSLDWRSIKEVIGVVKAYTTRVGAGPFPTEQHNEIGAKLQQVGKEIGVTTGRQRRCGWLDLVLVKYSHEVNGYTAINLTKLDILDDFDEIQVAVGYSHNGQALESFPANGRILAEVQIQYKTFPGWKKSTYGAKSYYDLPSKAREYVDFIEGFVGVPVRPRMPFSYFRLATELIQDRSNILAQAQAVST